MLRDRKWILIWLITGALMVAIMVVIGGITRLTHSGLSMTDWKLIMGMIPPLNDAEWTSAFNQYKQFPEYQKVNSHFTISDFKSIFFWEYLHRFLGRVIGIVFIVPFVIFLVRKSFNREYLFKFLILLAMGAAQGFLGWFMVKSGLINRPSVSHYRLAIHLSAAFLTFCYIIWVLLDIVRAKRNATLMGSLPFLSQLLTVVVAIQIIFGAFTAGLKAGFIFPTWPKMGADWMPDAISSAFNTDGFLSLFNNIISVQFVHRTFAYVVVALILFIWIKAKKLNLNPFQKKSISFLLMAVMLQFTLGVFTLLLHVPIWLAVAHQFGALVLISASVIMVYGFRTAE